MKERGVLFMDAMVRAILAGHKTVTRRTGSSWAAVQPGELLWVREAHALAEEGPVRYRADSDPADPGPWRPARHMPRRASRLLLRVRSLEWDPDPLQMSEEEARREGFASAEAFRAAWREMHGGGGAWRILFEVAQPSPPEGTGTG